MIIFDLDGTLSLVGNREKYIKQSNPDWNKFFKSCGEDKPNIPIVNLYNTLRKHYFIKVVTGRSEDVREITLKWFKQNKMELDSKDLIMRKSGDFRSDVIIKPELIKPFADKIEILFDDRDGVVDMWRKIGYTCLQVAPGKF